MRHALLLLVVPTLSGCESMGARTGQDPRGPALFAPNDVVDTEEEAAARELADPTATIGRMGFALDHVAYAGDLPRADRQDSTTLLFEPSLPCPLQTGLTLFVRPIVPVLFDQPVFDGTDFDSEGVDLGDIDFDVGYGGSVNDTGLILLGGLAGTMPTATQHDVGAHKWSIGPELMIGHLQEWGAAGVLMKHEWDVSSTSPDSENVNVSGGQYFYTYLLSGGWAIGSEPEWSYDWDADGGDRLTFPIGSGISRTMILGRTPWKFALEGNYYVERPDSFGPEWSVRLSITPVVPLPW